MIDVKPEVCVAKPEVSDMRPEVTAAVGDGRIGWICVDAFACEDGE